MIASQKIGKSFMGALKYNWKKLFNADPKRRAEVLSTNFVSMDLAVIKQEVDIVRSFRPALNKYVYHTSLNFSKEDVLDNKKMLAIAEDYLRLSGYTNNQYFIFRHHDADHPHLHLLVNRITFDGDVVSDSNNYKKSEAILRKLEQQYNLVPVEQSNHIPVEESNHKPVERTNSISKNRSKRVLVEQDNVLSGDQSNAVPTKRYNKPPLRAPTKNEIEMVIRTHKGSDKMMLQDKLLHLVSKPGITLQDFMIKCEADGIHLLFNQASTGRVSGITYFYGKFKIKGQALGNRFKWAELIKTVDYEQGRDGQAIRQANERTRGIYGDYTQGLEATTGGLGDTERSVTPNAGELLESTEDFSANKRDTARTGEAAYSNETGADGSAYALSKSAQVDDDTGRYNDWRDSGVGYIPDVEISDDIDDEAILGKNRRRLKQARTNTR
jgi:hypothetical protein